MLDGDSKPLKGILTILTKHIQLIEREFKAAAFEGNLELYYKFRPAYAIPSFLQMPDKNSNAKS